MSIIERLAKEFGIMIWQAQAVVNLLDEGNTVPFIARYRKEKHGELDDQKLREIAERLNSLRNLEKRRDEIIESLKKLNVWNEELDEKLKDAQTMTQLEDLYRPYRPKRRTRAMIAREKGLEPLADLILLQLSKASGTEELAAPYVDPEKNVNTADEAIQGAKDIIAERISDNAEIRDQIRKLYQRDAILCSKAASEEDSVYRMYYDYREPVRTMPGHRILAVDRGEREGFLKISLDVSENAVQRIIQAEYIAHTGSITTALVEEACLDAFDRLIGPSIHTEIRNALTDKAQEAAIHVFAANLRPLLMQPPVRGKVTIGLDPGIRTGCKVAVVDATGKVLDTAVIFPLPTHGRVREAKEITKRLIGRYGVSVAAIGNGTAGRETEKFFADLMKEMEDSDLGYVIVSEAGASVYSASKLAAEEFPQFDVSLRSAVSIARRLQDPLAELVKIDPKAIGVGQYQHDLKENELDHALDGVVEDCVNKVGVDVNTASPSLLSHVAGINNTVAKNIVAYREENGPFTSRNQLKKVPKLGPKAFEQCAGFLRIPGGKDPIENTGVHPESYEIAKGILAYFGEEMIGAASRSEDLLSDVHIRILSEKLEAGEPTIRDIIQELLKPGRDPRDELPAPVLRSDILEMSDLSVGMQLNGTVRNVTDFGAFVDIGVHRDGLVHISRMSRKRIMHPSEIVSVGDVVTVWVTECDMKTNRIGLTMVRPMQSVPNTQTAEGGQNR